MLLASVGWKRGCQTFSCPWSENVTYYRKAICSTCLSKESIPAIPFRNSKHPIPKRSLRSLRAAVGSAISALNYGCIMPIPWLQLQKKPVLCTEVIVSKIWITGYRVRSQLRHVTAANQWTIMSHSRHSFWDFQASTPHQKQVPESDSTLHQFCMTVASCPSLRCSFRKSTCLMQRSKVVSKIC